MATRAAIIYLDPETLTITSTYNHYDGYPDSLGAALEGHYDDDINAKKIASEGYISYLDLATGEIEVTNPSDRNVKPEIMNLTDDEPQSASDIIDLINSYGADYAYIWSPALDKWVTFKNSDNKTLYMKLEQMMPELLGRGNFEEGGMMENKDYMTEWKNFLNEDKQPDFDAIENYIEDKIKGSDPEQGRQIVNFGLENYMDSLKNDFRLGQGDEFKTYTMDDYVEDFNNYVADKMDS